MFPIKNKEQQKLLNNGPLQQQSYKRKEDIPTDVQKKWTKRMEHSFYTLKQLEFRPDQKRP